MKVALEPRGGRRFAATVGERKFEVDYVAGSLLLDGRSLEFTSSNGQPGRATVSVAGEVVKVATPSRRSAAGGAGSSSGTVSAPMNGQVVKLLKAVGDEVAQGEVVAVLEAMKMENEVAAPCSGKLQEVCVAEGQAVEPGDILFRVTPSEG